ncbi:MAG TPA: hypothetical protein VMG60_11790 [Burkholderiaceae bacterium]|nr:hypothetical protein [Burkholderiaceae bacterium]
MKNTIRGLAIVLAILITACGFLVLAVPARVDTHRALPEIVLPPVQVLATKPRDEQRAGATPESGTGPI